MTETKYSAFKFALERYLTIDRLSNGHLQLSHGAQFSRKGGVLGWFLMLFLLLLGFIFIANGAIWVGTLLFVFTVLLLAYIIDLQGIEIDLKNGKGRSYRSFLTYKYGTWYALEEPLLLRIYEDAILEGHALAGGSSYQSQRAFDTHHFYTLYLVLASNKTKLKLYEDESVTKVKLFALKFAETSQLAYDERIYKGDTALVRA